MKRATVVLLALSLVRAASMGGSEPDAIKLGDLTLRLDLTPAAVRKAVAGRYSIDPNSSGDFWILSESRAAVGSVRFRDGRACQLIRYWGRDMANADEAIEAFMAAVAASVAPQTLAAPLVTNVRDPTMSAIRLDLVFREEGGGGRSIALGRGKTFGSGKIMYTVHEQVGSCSE